MPNLCEVCGAIDAPEQPAEQDSTSLFQHDLHVCENCRRDREPMIRMEGQE